MLILIEQRITCSLYVPFVLKNRKDYIMMIALPLKHYQVLCLLNPNQAGGGGIRPPSTFRAISSQRDKLPPRCFMTFFFQVSRNFWDPNCCARAYRFDATPVRKKFVNPKIAPKRDFVYKSNANCVFSINSHKNSYLHLEWPKLIYFSIIMLRKMSVTNFGQKTNKNKRSKNKEIHKKFKKQ